MWWGSCGGGPMTDANHEMETTYCGVRAHQWWSDYLVWEKLLNLHPEIDAIFEIGTGIGGFARYLQHQCEERKLGFWTFDIAEPAADIAGFSRRDVFEPGTVEWLASMLSQRRVVLHCDGPDKPREIATYGQFLCPGSLAVVHDYGSGFHHWDIPDCMERVHQNLSAGGLTCILERRA